MNTLSFRLLRYDPERSINLAKQALTLADSINAKVAGGQAMAIIAVYYQSRAEYDRALQYSLDALRIGEAHHASSLIAECDATLGTIYLNLGEKEKSRRYLEQGFALNEKLNDVLIGSKLFNTMGLYYLDQRVYDSAMQYFYRSKAIMEDHHEDYRLPEVINNIGLVYTRKGNNQLAVQWYKASLQVAEKANNKRAQALALFNIGNTILSEKKYDEAERLLLRALTFAKEMKYSRVTQSIYGALGQLKNETGKFDEAHGYLSAFFTQRDSLINIARMEKIAELELRYETEKKQHAIELLERDKKIQRLWMNIMVVMLVFTIILLALLYYLKETRDRKNLMALNLAIEELTTQNKELSDKYKDVLAIGHVKAVESADQRLLKNAIQVVDANLSNPSFGVEQMAREMGMSRTSMHRKIKAITGYPPSDLIRNMRLRRAASLLLHKVDSVSQIGYTVGFEDHSYFSKSFKKQFGLTPSEYVQASGKADSSIN